MATMSLMEKMLKSGSIKTTTLANSIIFNKKDMVQTPVPIINVAFSGDLDGGMVSGLTLICGPSKHFKSNLGLVCVKAYLDKYPDAICLFYDSEFGITPDYIKSNGIDANRVLHIPVEHIEQLKFDVTQRLNDIVRGDKVVIFIDSVGNLASKKESEDALEGKGAADMSRAKSLKSTFRIITPHLTTKDIPCIAVNHIYMEQSLFPKAIVSGGCVEAGTLIKTVNGLTAIEEIRVGDYVDTLLGPKKVPECYDITFDDGHKVRCSSAHKFLIDGKWVEAKDIAVGDDVDVA
jgi:hypothetical protein